MISRLGPASLALALGALPLPACGDDPAPAAETLDTTPATLVDVATDAADVSAPGDAEADVTTHADADTGSDTVADVEPPLQGPPTLAERGFTEVRLIAHLHSAFSHDGCDDQGLDEDGNPNWSCIRRMKRALCSERIGLAFMTDHPSFMREQVWDELFYVEGPDDDVVLRGDDGTPYAARFACDQGEGGPDGKVTLMVGFEGTHTMPLGLRGHLDPELLYSVSFVDTTSSDDLATLTTAVGALGGHVGIAHSEQDDLSAGTIADHDVAAMELYNFHANFNAVMDDNLFIALGGLERFLDPTTALPDPDLTALVMLATYPEPALDKWRQVSAIRPITAFAGSDVHENVSFPPACADTDGCDGLADAYPNLVAYLRTGGPVWQSDGERLDGYARIFRWVQNRVFVPTLGEGAKPPDELVLEHTEASFFGGRNAVVFEVLGDAQNMALIAETADGELHDLGETLPVDASTTLWVRSPDLPLPPRFSTWTDASPARLESILWRTDATGTHEVLRFAGAGTWKKVPLDAAGSYHLEVWLEPRQLAPDLGPAAELAERPYRWVELNAIRAE